MTQAITLRATARTLSGKGASRRLRRTKNAIPAILYGTNKAPANIELEHRIVTKACENEKFYSQIMNLDIDGEIEPVIVKAMQRHPYKPVIMHMDFLRIDLNKPMHARVPLHVLGEAVCPALKNGFVLSKNAAEVEITCLPRALPEMLTIDISAIEGEAVLHLTDIKLPEGVAVAALAATVNHNLSVLSIHKSKEVEVVAPVEEAKPAKGKAGAKPAAKPAAAAAGKAAPAAAAKPAAKKK